MGSSSAQQLSGGLAAPAVASAGHAGHALAEGLERTRESGHELASVQLLRAVAALAVVFWHLSWVSRAFPDAVALAPTFLAFGNAGVDLFFAISGYIICHITVGRPFAPGRFAARRALRIFPFYAGFTGLAVLAAAINPAWDGGGQLGLGYALRSALALPMQGLPLLAVGWSLEHEAIFYLLAGVLLAAGLARALPWLLLALFAAGIAVHVLWPAFGGHAPWDLHLFSLYHFEFAVGVVLFRVRDRLPVRHWRGLALAGLAVFAATAHVVASHALRLDPVLHVPTDPAGGFGLLRVIGYGTASGLLLAAGLGAERSGALEVSQPWKRALLDLALLVGEASFLLYLGHFFVYSALAKLYAALGAPAWLWLPSLAAALVAAVAFAIACHLLLERPFLRAVRRRV